MESNNGAERAEVGADTVAVAERRWPAWVAVFTSGVMPATTARRTAHVGFAGAFLVHVFGAILYWLARCCHMSMWMEDSSITDAFLLSLGSFTDPLWGNAVEEILEILSWVGIAELLFLLLALLTSPWGAKDEPWGASVWAAVRRLWLHTPQLAFVVLIVAMVDVKLDAIGQEWEENWESDEVAQPSYPVFPGANATEAELEEYSAAQQEYNKQIEAYSNLREYKWKSQPWYLKYGYVIAEGVHSILNTLWFLTLLRSVGTERRVVPVERALTCENCGYNLTGALPDARCSECGEPVAVSSSRRRSPWDLRREVGRVRCWWQCTKEATFRPRQFGRKLPAIGFSVDHRRFLLMNLTVIVALSMVGMLVGAYILDEDDLFASGSVYVLLSMMYCGYGVVVLLLCYSLFAATVAGMWYRLSAKRNLLPATMQAASYMSGYLCFWALFNCVTIPTVVIMGEWGVWQRLGPSSGDIGEMIAFGICFVSNLVMAVFYLGNVFRISSGARWANS